MNSHVVTEYKSSFRSPGTGVKVKPLILTGVTLAPALNAGEDAL